MSVLKQKELRDYSKKTIKASVDSLELAKKQGKKTIFLSHSHNDKDLAEGLRNKLLEEDIEVYIDWKDTSMPDTPDVYTAIRIKNRIHHNDIFMLLATENSCKSRWCPWEIGYADGIKLHKYIVVVPTVDDSGKFHGNEYLQLYQRLNVADSNRLAVFGVGKTNGAAFKNYGKKSE